ncbi:MAG: ABC transporter ATP-binding protein [Succinivibrionaceae bacterium]|nr:ABC transporter ATP-binding protein [Succinivibrionaceae bacterium]
MNLIAKNLCMSFEKTFRNKASQSRIILDQVDFRLDRGRITQIVGPSGCGKSTFLNILCGLLKPQSGEVLYDGENIYNLSDRQLSELRNCKFGIALQNNIGIGSITTLENINLPLAYQSGIEEVSLKRARHLIEQLNISHLAECLPGELSGGEMRRMCIARALINCPEFIFADEPTSDLDPQNTAIVMSVLRKAAQNGAGILIVSHDREISSYTDETYTVSEAQLRRVSEE